MSFSNLTFEVIAQLTSIADSLEVEKPLPDGRSSTEKLLMKIKIKRQIANVWPELKLTSDMLRIALTLVSLIASLHVTFKNY